MPEFCRIKWLFHRKTSLTILTCIGKSTSETATGILLQTAVNIIEKAKEFEGVPTRVESEIFLKEGVAVQFCLLFKQEEGLENFAKYINAKKGHY